MTSPADVNYKEQELRALGWPPASISAQKAQKFALPALRGAAGTGRLFGDGCGHRLKPRATPTVKTPLEEAFTSVVL